LNQEDLERVPVYDRGATAQTPFERFMQESGNSGFKLSVMTFLCLLGLLVLYPVISVLYGGDPSALEALADNQGALMVILIVTVMLQWIIFLFVYLAAYLEKTGMAGLGFKRFRFPLDLVWAFAFFLGALVVIEVLALALAALGLPMPGEIAFLIPQNTWGRIIWVIVSFTAGFCEEGMFRGYLLTRLRTLGKFNSWWIPVIISSVAFGACHAYQGWAGFILTAVYGAMFAWLYIRTGTIWPCVIAHTFQDIMALFVPF
jgi:membrane protease YdiL (CAAX protease family)